MSQYIRYPANGGGSGTVTSVALIMPGIFSVAGSPVTGDGTLTVTLTTETANKVWAGPTSGGAAIPTFRSLVAADIPALSYVTSVGLSLPSFITVSNSPVTSSGTLTGVLATQAANKIFGGPSTGADAAPTFRSLVAADLPSTSLTSAHIFVGNVSNVAADVAMSGDITIDNTGATAIGAGKVTNTMLAGSIAYSKLVLTNSILNADINSSAAIAYSKLDLTGSIVNADVNTSAAIAYSKLALSNSILNADINSAAAVVYSKLSLGNSILNADINSSAAIAYSKLSLTGSILNADINASAAIAYSKLNLATSIVNADISTSAAIVRTKIANSIVTAKTGTYTILSSDDIVTGDTTSAGFTLTLPAASSNSGKIYYIKKIDSSTNVLTVSRAGSDLIDGATTTTLTIQYESITLISDGGTNWLIF